MKIDLKSCYPQESEPSVLIGKIWDGGEQGGPCVVLIESEQVYDISSSWPILAELLNQTNLDKCLQKVEKKFIGSVFELLENTDPEIRDRNKPYFLAPCDFQSIKACGVTFTDSMLERLVDEHAQGDPDLANQFRDSLERDLRGDLSKIKPASPEAERIKKILLKKNLWSQYLEVGIGPDAEVFTKAQPMSAIGTGETLGIRSDSAWNNPEPEIVLVINSIGKIIGASLGNDVNLRDFEGRSALLLGKAKDNNAACVIGPFIRLFNHSFGLKDIRSAVVEVEVHGEDGFEMKASSNLSKISRDVEILASQTINPNHQYPDGLMLFTGTLFAPTQDRDSTGAGFTHKPGDVVSIYSPKLGKLVNRVNYCHKVPPWEFGTIALIRNLTKRRLL
jgi:fumarylacetoacetate (FAA) hydrolase family protein